MNQPLTRMLRKDISVEQLCDCMIGFRCGMAGLEYMSCMDAIGQELLKEHKDE